MGEQARRRKEVEQRVSKRIIEHRGKLVPLKSLLTPAPKESPQLLHDAIQTLPYLLVPLPGSGMRSCTTVSFGRLFASFSLKNRPLPALRQPNLLCGLPISCSPFLLVFRRVGRTSSLC